MAPARRLILCMLAFASIGLLAAPSGASAARPPTRVTVQADVADDATGGSVDDDTTTTVVAAQGPVPDAGVGARAPGIGPVLVPADGSSFTGAWWLVAFGGLQLVGLFLITRRARARLSPDEPQP